MLLVIKQTMMMLLVHKYGMMMIVVIKCMTVVLSINNCYLQVFSDQNRLGEAARQLTDALCSGQPRDSQLTSQQYSQRIFRNHRNKRKMSFSKDVTKRFH